MRFEVLGPVRVSHGGEPVLVPGTLRRNLLAMLLAHANEPVAVEALLDALWGEQPDRGRVQRLHLHVHKLRALLGEPARITHGPGGYSLSVGEDELDVVEFDALFDQAHSISACDPLTCADLLRRALGLFRGRPYRDVDLIDLTGEIQRCAERRLVALEECFSARIRCGQHTAVVGELREAVGRHPLRERLHGLLMTALSMGGRQADALAAYRRARDVLGEELGLDPGPELQQLERQVLTGEPVRMAGMTGRAPAQLPTAPAGFVGRDHELAQLDALLERERDAAVIGSLTGAGGVGKTTMALLWAHRVRDRFPDGQLYVDLRGFGPGEAARPDDALMGFLRALGAEGARLPEDPAERSARYRSLLAGTRTLIVLDNAHSATQVRPLLPATRGCAVLVTSRDPLVGLGAREGAERIVLDSLSTEESRRLLREQLGSRRVDAEPEAIDLLIDRCARLPLALRMAIERIRLRGTNTVAELVEELGRPSRLEVFEDDVDPHSSVRSVFSWSYRHLTEEAAESFRYTGLHPGNALDAAALAALVDQDEREAHRSLDALQRAHLVQRSDTGRYVRHDLLRAYAHELSHEAYDDDTRRAASERLLRHYVSTATQAMDRISPGEAELPAGPAREMLAAQPPTTQTFFSYAAARQWMDAERDNLMRLAYYAPDYGHPAYTTALDAIVWPYLDVGCYYDDAELIHTRALDVARDQDDPIAEGIALRGLGLHHLRQDHLEEAREHLARALRRLPAHGAESTRAMTLNYLGSVYNVLGPLEEAVRHFRLSLQVFDRAGAPAPRVRTLNNLGLAYTRQERYDDAEKCLQQALSVAEAGAHRVNTAYSLTNLARLYRDTGLDETAFRYAVRACESASENRFPGVEGVVLEILGTINTRLGHTQEAVSCLQRVLAFGTMSGDATLVANAHNGLGEAHAADASVAEAEHHFRQALAAVPGETGRNACRERARAHRGLGDLHAALGEDAQAADHRREARGIEEEAECSPVGAGLART